MMRDEYHEGHKYAYVRNNPLIYKDPSGKEIYWTSNSGFGDFMTVLGLAMDDPVLMDELLAHECWGCPDLFFDGEKRGLTEDGKPVKALTASRIDPQTGEYEFSRISTNPDLLHEVDRPETLVHEMGHVNDFRTNSEEAVRDSKRGARGKRAKEYRAEHYKKGSKERREEQKRQKSKPCIGCDPPPGSVRPKTVHYARAGSPGARCSCARMSEVA